MGRHRSVRSKSVPTACRHAKLHRDVDADSSLSACCSNARRLTQAARQIAFEHRRRVSDLRPCDAVPPLPRAAPTSPTSALSARGRCFTSRSSAASTRRLSSSGPPGDVARARALNSMSSTACVGAGSSTSAFERSDSPSLVRRRSCVTRPRELRRGRRRFRRFSASTSARSRSDAHLEEVDPSCRDLQHARILQRRDVSPGRPSDAHPRPLCPVAIRPVHYVAEVEPRTREHFAGRSRRLQRRAAGFLGYNVASWAAALPVRGAVLMTLFGVGHARPARPARRVPMARRPAGASVAQDGTSPRPRAPAWRLESSTNGSAADWDAVRGVHGARNGGHRSPRARRRQAFADRLSPLVAHRRARLDQPQQPARVGARLRRVRAGRGGPTRARSPTWPTTRACEGVWPARDRHRCRHLVRRRAARHLRRRRDVLRRGPRPGGLRDRDSRASGDVHSRRPGDARRTNAAGGSTTCPAGIRRWPRWRTSRPRRRPGAAAPGVRALPPTPSASSGGGR